MAETIAGDGVHLHYVVHGTGAPVVLLHGFPLSGRMWDDVVAPLASEWRLIVPDLRGHGASGASERVDMARYADDVIAVLDAVAEARPAVIAGLSMGGYVALELYRRHPSRVRALVLSDTRAGRDTPEVAAGRLESAERVLEEGTAVVAGPMVEKLFAASTGQEMRGRWREIMEATPPAGVAAALRAMAARRDSRRLLRGASFPVLAIVGAEDAVTPPGEVRKMAEAAPKGRLRVIPEAGHLPPIERPGEFTAVMADFLRSLPPLAA